MSDAQTSDPDSAGGVADTARVEETSSGEQKKFPWKRVIQALISLVIVVGI